jgi:hypothetical protein
MSGEADWSECKSTIEALFGPGAYEVTYLDCEEDQVTIRLQDDWQECLNVNDGSALHLQLVRVRPSRRKFVGIDLTPRRGLTTTEVQQSEGSPTDAAEGKADSEEIVSSEEAEGGVPKHESSTAEPPQIVEEVRGNVRKPGPSVVDPPQTVIQHQQDSTWHDLFKLGYRALQGGEYCEALSLFEQAREIEASPDILYNVGCCHALMGHKHQALTALRAAVSGGFHDWQHILADQDLRSLRSEQQFIQLVEDLRQAACNSTVPSTPQELPRTIDNQPKPSSPSSFDAACRFARQGRKYQALKALRESIEAGFNDVQRMEENQDLALLKPERQFQEILEEMQRTRVP